MERAVSSVKVLIVESLSPGDLMKEWRESRATRDVLCTLGIDCLLHECRSEQDLQTACKIFAHGDFDVLHLASHGCEDGVCLTDGSMVTWPELATMLGPSIAGKQLVLSACKGGCSNIPTMYQALPSRPFAIVGPSHDVPWTDLLVAWQVYYKAVFPTSGPEDSPCTAVSRVKMATGTSLNLYMRNSSGNYDRWEPTPYCGMDVFNLSFPQEVQDPFFDESTAEKLVKATDEQLEQIKEILNGSQTT